jgi:hypothetical protein
MLVDCHSMPSIGVSRRRAAAADIVIGDRYGTSCAPLLPDTVEETMSGSAIRSAATSPMPAASSPSITAIRPRLHTIQLELNRAIYMDERRRERGAALRASGRGFRRAGRRAGRDAARRSRPVPGGGGVSACDRFVIPGRALGFTRRDYHCHWRRLGCAGWNRAGVGC